MFQRIGILSIFFAVVSVQATAFGSGPGAGCRVSSPPSSERIRGPQAGVQEEIQGIPARGVLDIHQGTVSVWVKFQPHVARRDHLIFQTDDSRLALFVDTYSSQGMRREIVRLGARAGGNKKFRDPGANFPEASIIIDNTGALATYRHAWYSPVPFPEGQWHFVAMTWQGYPKGVVRIYFDGQLKGQKPYDQNYDDGRPLFETYAVGQRPWQWPGELKGGKDLRPKTNMSLESGGIKIKDLKFHAKCLSGPELMAMMGFVPGASSGPNTTKAKDPVSVPKWENEAL